MNNLTQPVKITEVTMVKELNIGQFLKDKGNQIQAALPRHLKLDRLLRIAVTEINKIPKLRNCTVNSLFSAIIQCSQLGLEPGGVLGHAYLIPFDKYKKDSGNWVVEKTECNFMLGYRGMIDLARRSGHIVSISAQVIYSNDEFEFEYGLNEKLRHVPAKGDRGEFIGAYALAKLKDGGYQMEVMFKNEIEKARASSQAKNKDGSPTAGTPWAVHYNEMARKTVLRRLFKYLPISIELADAMHLDYQADKGEQDNSHVIEGVVERDETDDTSNKSSKIAKRLANKKPEELNHLDINPATLNQLEEAVQQESEINDDNWTEDFDKTQQL